MALGLAKVVDRDIKCGEEGVDVEHEESVPFPSESVSADSSEWTPSAQIFIL